MTTSPSRTIVIGAGRNPSLNAAVLSDPLLWPVANPGSSRGYTLDITAVLEDLNDDLAGVNVSASPSGSGELSILGVQAAAGVITAWLSVGSNLFPCERTRSANVVRATATPPPSGQSPEARPSTPLRKVMAPGLPGPDSGRRRSTWSSPPSPP
jgi:hypothetical protein